MEILIPEVGESVHEAFLAKWFKSTGDRVARDEPLCEIETDKITMELHADTDGILTVLTSAGSTVPVGAVVGTLAELSAMEGAPPGDLPSVLPAPARGGGFEDQPGTAVSSPSVRSRMRQEGIAPDAVTGTGPRGRITAEDLDRYAAAPLIPPAAVSTAPVLSPQPVTAVAGIQAELFPQVDSSQLPRTPRVETPAHTGGSPVTIDQREERKSMSPIRRRISEHLIAARQQTAMLTTFNEADLSRIKSLRQRYREPFIQRHGAPLGLMPFFVKACVEALKEFPGVNASIDGGDIVYHHYYDISIAIGSEKGLVVPVLRDADRMHLHEIDRAIAAFSEKIRTNQLAISDLDGGVFTISNGGSYGSLLSTPILNVPQSAVLGMHAIQDRPVVQDGQIVIRPMMYLALSYDHRLIDGREAVGFLKKIREYIEEPEELLLEG